MSNDPRNVSSAGLNQELADAVDVIVAALMAAPNQQVAYAAGLNLGELVSKLHTLQS